MFLACLLSAKCSNQWGARADVSEHHRTSTVGPIEPKSHRSWYPTNSLRVKRGMVLSEIPNCVNGIKVGS